MFSIFVYRISNRCVCTSDLIRNLERGQATWDDIVCGVPLGLVLHIDICWIVAGQTSEPMVQGGNQPLTPAQYESGVWPRPALVD